MRKRFLSWLLVLTMVTSLIPSTLVTTAFAAGTVVGNTTKYTNELPSTLDTAITDIAWNITAQPNDTIVVGNGQTLIVHGTGGFSTGTRNAPVFEVQSGGHLVLDNIGITNCKVSEKGAVYVHSGGLLDLGYNDRSERRAPSITRNTYNNTAKNLVVEDGARIRLNTQATKAIGIYYNGNLGAPYAVVESGRYTLADSDLGSSAIVSENADYRFSINYGDIYIQRTTPKVLFLDPGARSVKGIYGIDYLAYVFREGHASSLVTNLKRAVTDTFIGVHDSSIKDPIRATVDYKEYQTERSIDHTKGSYSFNDIDNIMQYDMILVNGAWGTLTPEGRQKLITYLNAGGAIYFQSEDTQETFNGVRAAINAWMQDLGATRFEAMNSPSGAATLDAWLDNSTAYVKRLTENMPTRWHVQWTAPIKSGEGIEPIFMAKFLDQSDYMWGASFLAGERGDGAKYGRLLVVADGNWVSPGNGSDYLFRGNIAGQFFTNLLRTTKENRITAAAGYNPNAEITYQATTTTTTTTKVSDYRTPYAALQKAVENNTVTLLTKDQTVDATNDELLFEDSTLAYQEGSTYARSTIHADTAGVYLDITKTGEVNLRSGTVTVTPKDATYPLVLNGTMDQDGATITDGYKITSNTAYTLDADDPTSPILAENGGKASIVIPNAGESVTVDYGNGKTVTYTAKEKNEKVYLGWYQVNKNTPASATWTDSDKAWYGHPFTTTLGANTGFEVNGEKLTVADAVQVGNYTMVKKGDAVQDPDDKNASWTTYESTETDRENKPKVTIKQKHWHTGNVDRNGEAIVIVNDVRADITIGAADGAVNAASPTIYVVGVGQRAGQADVQLWEYTTTRNTKDGNLQKPVNGWPWEKWKVVKAASATGTQLDYTNNKNGFKDTLKANAGTTDLNTTNPTAEYAVDLFHGDKVVVFYYDWNMTEVTIKATDAKGNPIPDYTDQVVEYESNKRTTITAPNLIGYQPVAGQNTKDFTPSETNKEITFQYEKTTGNLIYKAVYVDGAGVNRELGTFSGGTLVQGQAPNKSAQYAPRFDNYELADKTADGVASAESYTGTDITVTYTYKAKVKTIPVEAYVDSTSGVRLLNDTTTYKDITTGQTITVTAPDIAGYKVKGAASQTVFVTNDTGDEQKVVFLYEKDNDNDAYVLVKLVDSSNGDKLISSYQVPGVKDKAQLIKAPDAPYGYKADPNHPNVDKTVTPSGTQPPYKVEVEFKYVPNVHTVTIKLEDSSKSPAAPLTVNNYVTSYKVVDGEDLTIIAPSIYGYTMAKNSESVKVLRNITGDETVTFQYEPIDKQMVYIHVKGVGPDSKTLFESRETVTHGTVSKEVNVFTPTGLKLSHVTVGGADVGVDKVTGNKLTVDTSHAAKGAVIEVVLTYESNMTDVTVKAMYNGKEIQSYTLPLEKGVTTAVNAPSVTGYTADASSKTVTPGDDSAANTVTFTYTKAKGNVTVVVVDATEKKELYRKDGGTVDRGTQIELTGDAAAPTIEYYTTPTDPKSVMVNGTEVKGNLATYQYDGVGDIIVTYEYTRKTRDITIIKKDVDTGKEIADERETLNTLPVGKSHTFLDGSVKIPNNYQAVTDRNPTSYFVEDKTGQTVTFWYKNTSADQYAQVKVNLICDDDDTTFQSYQVTAIKGVPTTIPAPTWNGYTFAGTQDDRVRTVTPDGTPENDKVEFHYTITNPKKVEVVLKDNSNGTNPKLNAPANYTDSYTLKMGDSVMIWAPAIDGYSLVSATLGTNPAASNNKQMVQVSYDALSNGTTTVTFAYMPVSQADFVKHTVNFELTLPGGTTQPLYTHEKLIPKGTGNQVVYKEDDVKYTVPGYAYRGISYEVGNHTVGAADVKDNVNATITYRFEEASAWIKINQQCTVNTDHKDTQTLTGYREGQENVMIIAPVLKDHALKSDQLMSYTFAKLNTGENEHTFLYEKAGDTRFVLKEIGTDKIIAVLNAEGGKNYNNPNADDSPLNLSKIGYTYTLDNNASEPFRPGSTDQVDTTKPGEYTVYYKKMTREVEFVAVDKTKLDGANKKLDDAIKDNSVVHYTISGLNPVTPEEARVGESYKAVAQSFDNWALKDDYSKYYEVPVGTDPLKVYFMYVPKTTGTVTVHYHFGTADDKGEKFNEYTITAVAGENLKISAPDYLLNNKYHLRATNKNPYHLTVTQSPETVDFYYEANFVTVTTKVNLDGTDNGTHETYEVIKDTTSGSGSATLYPPEKAGYTLVGINATGATLINGGADKLPTQYTNNKLALTGLTQDATVTYYYKTTKASEYQTTLTVEYKYNGYDLAAAKTINANTGEANSIDIPAFDGYKASTYDFKDGSKATVTGAGISGTTVSVTPAEKTATLTITYTRPDGSIVLPGKGDKIGDSDDIIVKPTDPNTPPTLNPGPNPVKGSVTIPDNTTGTVTRPKDPTKPADGKEDIIVPGGTTIDKDGTIHLPDNGGTINPGDKFPIAALTDYISVIYKANGGTGDDVIDLIKNGQPIKARTNTFTYGSQTFTGWNTADNGVGGTLYQATDTITVPAGENSVTLYAQWGKANFAHSTTITYLPNDGTGDTNKKVVTVGSNTDANFKANLLDTNPFSVTGWTFGGWHKASNGVGSEPKRLGAEIDATAGTPQTWYAQWYRVNADGSITVPGEDGNPNTPDNNVTANGNGTKDPDRKDTGEVDIPAGGNVVKGNETIALPNGGTLKPDGSLSINKPNGGGQIEVKPDGTTDNADVVVLTYQANNGTNDTRKVYATKGEDIAPLAANTFSYSGHAFLYWKSGDTIFKTNGTITPTDAMTLSAVWAKVNPDGSVELPGKDGKLEGPGNEKDDKVTVTPDKPNGTLDGPKADGSVEVKGDEATVTRPDPQNPDKKEDIKVPEGTVVEPDGTIKLPDGTVIAPDKRIPDDVTLTNYFVVTYEPGDGSGDVIRDVITKNADTTLRDEDTFTTPNSKIFDGWLDGAQTKHDAGDTLKVSKSMTFTAQWKDGTPTPPAPKYSSTIVFDPNTGDATATQTVTSADSSTITRNLDAYTQHFTAPAGWTFMGWSTTQAASQSSSFHADGAEVMLKDKSPLNLYAILYKQDADTKVITLPGKGGQPEGGDDVTVTPGAGADLTVDKGFIKAPAGSEIKQPANATPIKVIEGEVNVYPDGSVFVPKGSKVQLPDGTEVDGEATIDPDGKPDTDNTKPVQRPDGTIVLPGENGKTGDPDDITIAPAGPNKPAGRIDEDGNVTITTPDGADVNLPGNTPEDIKVPNGTVIKPNGEMTLLYTIRYVDGNGTEVKTATVKSVQRGIPQTVEAAVISGYTLNDTATKMASGEVSANLADYVITFTYSKNSSGGGGSSGGGSSGGGGGTVSSSFTIKASAGNGGIISPSGNVSVKRGDDQTFTISPINGYRISDVLVEGKSVGAVSTYTFDSVKANHTIEVKFAKLNAIVADPEVTGVAGWLQTRDHIAYLGGYGSGLFGPNDNMTRAQAAQMFYNLLLNKDVDITVNFTDVPADAWYGKAVHTLASLGIIAGIGNNQFAPNRTITRAEFAVIAMRFANLSADVTNPFSDVSENDWFYSAVTSAVSYGWIGGYSDGNFHPYATITRAEVATIVNRMLNRTADRNFVDSSAVTQFVDVPSNYWAYYNIMEATNAHTHTIDNDGVESWTKLK